MAVICGMVDNDLFLCKQKRINNIVVGPCSEIKKDDIRFYSFDMMKEFHLLNVFYVIRF